MTGFLSAVIAGRRERKGSAASIQWAQRNDVGRSSPALLPATKAERDPFDLRLAWLYTLAADTDGGDGGTGDGDAGLGGTGADEGEPEPLTDDEVKNPRIKALSDENAKWRSKLREAEARIKALEPLEGKVKELEEGHTTKAVLDQLRDAKVENAFILAAVGKVADVEAAWKLADRNGVTITDDGKVEGLEDVLTKVLEKHPYLAPKPTDPDAQALADKFPALTPSGKANNGKKGSKDTVDYAYLEKRFPALRSRR